MIGNIGGQSGCGGSGADFTVIAVTDAGSLPGTEKDKTVAVITSTPITSWAVADNPYVLTAKNGMVCISDSGITGQTWPDFNMLGKNAIWGRFVKCWQYIDGQWMAMDAYQRRDGQWVQFSTQFAATISITYPEWSQCTVSKGSIVLTAPNSNGYWEVVVPEPGDWLVRCTNDGKEKCVTVSITQSGQHKLVTISFQLDIFVNGQLDPSVGDLIETPALGGHDYPLTSSIQNAYDPKVITIDCEGNSSSQGYVYFGRKIDITPYDTLHLDIYSHYPKYEFAKFGIIQGLSAGGDFVAAITVNNAAKYTLDVSQVNGSYYVGFWGANSFAGRKSSRITIEDTHLV